MDKFMGDSELMSTSVSSPLDLHSLDFSQVPDTLFATPSQESPQQMQVENSETPLEHMDVGASKVSSHVDSLETVFTTSNDCNQLGLVVDTGPESIPEDDRSGQYQEESEEEEVKEPLSYELSQGFRILREVMADSNKSVNWPFMNEVDPEKDGVPDYLDRVEKPMWLKLMKKKFDDRVYESITEFVADFRLMLENCYRYNGPDHIISKRGQRLETILEQKLTLLSRDLREKTSIAATSGKSVEEKQITGTRRRKVLVPHDSTALLNQLRMEEKEREKEARKQQMMERQREREQFISELQSWEETLMDNKVDQYKAMWELPQIGHFFFLCQLPLNIGEVIQYELEKGFYMPRESSTIQNMMTTLLSTPYQRTKLDSKPMMPYKVWDEKLRVKLRQWYKLYRDSKKDVAKTCGKFGLDHQFFKVVGNKNPLETKKYHELSVYQRVWIVKGLCDNCLETQESIREAIESQPATELREYELGFDAEGNRYVHFPQFCGADLRVYRQSPIPHPKLERRQKSPSKREASSPTMPRKKTGHNKTKSARSTPSPSPSRQRHSRLRQNPRQAKQPKPNEISSDSEASGDESVITEGNESEGPSPRKRARGSKNTASAASTPSEVDALGNPLVLRRSLRKVLEESKHLSPVVSTPNQSRGGTPTRTSLRKLGGDVTVSRSSTPSISSKESLSTTTLTRGSRDSSPAPSAGESTGVPVKAAVRGGRRRRGRRGRRRAPIQRSGDASDCDTTNKDANVMSEDESVVSQPFDTYKDNDADSIAGRSISSAPVTKDKSSCNSPAPDADKLTNAPSDKALSDSEMTDDQRCRSESIATPQSSSTGISSVNKDASSLNERSESTVSTPVSSTHAEKSETYSNESIDQDSKLSVPYKLENEDSVDSPMASISTLNSVIKSEVDSFCEADQILGAGDAAFPNECGIKKEPSDDLPETKSVNGLVNGSCESQVEGRDDIKSEVSSVVQSDPTMSNLVNGDCPLEESVVKSETIETKIEAPDAENARKKDTEEGKSEIADTVADDEMSEQADVKPDLAKEESDDDWEEQFPEIGPFELVADSVELLKELTNKFAEPEPVVIGTGKKQKVIKPIPRKRCVADLHGSLTYLLKELEPWESKLIQARRKAGIKMRKELESFKEEPEVNEIEDVWESEESNSDDSSEESDSEDSNKQEESEDQPEQEGKLRSGKVRKKEEEQPEGAEFVQEVSSRGRVRKRKVIPNGAEEEPAKRGRTVPAPAGNVLLKTKDGQVVNQQGVRMTNLGQIRLQQPQGVSLLGGNQTLLIQGVGANQQKGPNSALSMKNSTLFAQLTSKNPAQQPQAQQINLKPGQNVNEVIKALLASGKQVAITANPQQLQMIAAQQQPRIGTDKQAAPQPLILAPQAGKQHVTAAVTAPTILKPKPAPGGHVVSGQSAIANILSSPKKSPVRAVTSAAVTSAGGTQYFSYNNLGQLPATMIQELLKKQNARISESQKTADQPKVSNSNTVLMTSQALSGIKQGDLLLQQVTGSKSSTVPTLAGQKLSSPTKAISVGEKPIRLVTATTLATTTQDVTGKVLIPSPGATSSVYTSIKPTHTKLVTTTAPLLGLLGSPTKPKYAGNVTVKTLLENRAAVIREENKGRTIATTLPNTSVLQAHAQLQLALNKPSVGAVKPITTLASGTEAIQAALEKVQTKQQTVTNFPIVAAAAAQKSSTLAAIPAVQTSSIPAVANSSPQIRLLSPQAKSVKGMSAGIPGNGNVITVPRLLLQGSTQIGQIPVNLIPPSAEGTKVPTSTNVVGGQKITALITGGGKGPQVTTITTSQLQAAIAKKQAIDNAVKAVFTTGVSTSLPTAQIKVSSPFAMPSRNAHRPVTITTSAMKAPIPALPQITSNEIKKNKLVTSSVGVVQGSLTSSSVTPQKPIITQAQITQEEVSSIQPSAVVTPEIQSTIPVKAVETEAKQVDSSATPVVPNSVQNTNVGGQGKPLAVKVTSQNIKTSQGIVPGVILPHNVNIPPQVLQQLASKQQGMVFLQQGKDGSMQIIQLPNSSGSTTTPTSASTPGKLVLPRVPTPTILKPAVPSEAANLHQQRLLQQQAAAATGIVSHQVSTTTKPMITTSQPSVVSPTNTTLSPRQLVSPTSVTVLPTQAVAIKGQAGTQIVSPTGNQMIASKLLLAASSIQQQQQVQKQQVVPQQPTQTQPEFQQTVQQVNDDVTKQTIPAVTSPVIQKSPLIPGNTQNSVPGIAKIQLVNKVLSPTKNNAPPQAVKLGTVPVSGNIRVQSSQSISTTPQVAAQTPAAPKFILQTNMGSPIKANQLTPAQLQALQQQLLQLQGKQVPGSAKQQVVQLQTQNAKVNAPAGTGVVSQPTQPAAATSNPAVSPATMVAAQHKVLLTPAASTAASTPPVSSGNQSGKLVLYNVNGQLVTAQGVPVNLGQGGIKLGSTVAAGVQQVKSGTVLQTGAANQTQKQLILAGGQVVQPTQVVGKTQPSQVVLPQVLSQTRVLNAGHVIQGTNVSARLPVLQQGQVLLQQGNIIGQTSGLQIVSKPVVNTGNGTTTVVQGDPPAQPVLPNSELTEN